MLKITRADKPITIEQLVLLIYALPGIGKSTLACTADAPLLYDFDKGAYRAKNRKDVVQIESWDDVANQTREDLEPYQTLIVDTSGRCLDVLTADIIQQSPKNARGSGDLTLQGFGVLKSRFTSWLKLMKSYEKDIVLVAHMDEKSEGDIVKERIDVQGGSKTEIYKSADAICKLYIDGKTRMLDFSPREGSLGKNPGQLDILAVPDFQKDPNFLAGVIRDIKASINHLSEAQRAEVEAVEAWRQRIGKAQTAQDFNGLLPDVKTATTREVVRSLVVAAANERGLKFNREVGEFYAPAAPKPEPIFDEEDANEPIGGWQGAAEEPNGLTEALQASVDSLPPVDEPEPTEAPEAKPAPKQSASWPLEAVLKSLKVGRSKTGEYQALEFEKFRAYNYHKKLFYPFSTAVGKLVCFTATERDRPGVVYVDDVNSVDGVKFIDGKPVPKGVANLFA